ncbi:hypothetical protein Nepgr_033606 [Nepenthes gracilis]|uniref:Uncharacterized protein n=1 Tax=Nepenthes gracilis TaxID=150966 RepID=A0AAD3TLR7_NEPGR|nr:hypothetical protein Nepgr_033606 [Nepenthes gracilis]
MTQYSTSAFHHWDHHLDSLPGGASSSRKQLSRHITTFHSSAKREVLPSQQSESAPIQYQLLKLATEDVSTSFSTSATSQQQGSMNSKGPPHQSHSSVGIKSSGLQQQQPTSSLQSPTIEQHRLHQQFRYNHQINKSKWHRHRSKQSRNDNSSVKGTRLPDKPWVGEAMRMQQFSATWDQPRIKLQQEPAAPLRSPFYIEQRAGQLCQQRPHLNRIAPKQNPSQDQKFRDPNNPIRPHTHHYSSQKALQDRASIST